MLSNNRYLNEHVTAEKNLEGVVIDKRTFKVEWLLVTHIKRTDDHNP